MFKTLFRHKKKSNLLRNVLKNYLHCPSRQNRMNERQKERKEESMQFHISDIERHIIKPTSIGSGISHDKLLSTKIFLFIAGHINKNFLSVYISSFYGTFVWICLSCVYCCFLPAAELREGLFLGWIDKLFYFLRQWQFTHVKLDFIIDSVGNSAAQLNIQLHDVDECEAFVLN